MRVTSRTFLSAAFALALPLGAAPVFAQVPVYSTTFGDAVTGTNSFVAADGTRNWTVTPGADSYQNDFYERPTTQTYQVRTLADATQRFAANTYFGNLDIVSARAGFDSRYLYTSITMFSPNKSTADGVNTSEGLVYRYGFRIGRASDGANGFLFVSDQPLLKHGTSFGLVANSGYQDTNGDVGGSGLANGLSITKEDNAAAAIGDGFDLVRISDGVIQNGVNAGQQVLFARIDPNNPNTVEFALDYGLLGYSFEELSTLGYLEFEAIKGGPKDNQNYLWNDQYTKSEAGSPYRATVGDLSKSEFGTQGLVNIYELDTLRGSGIAAIPEPETYAMMLAGLGLLGFVARRRRQSLGNVVPA